MNLHRDPLTGRARPKARQPADPRNTARHRGNLTLAALLTAAASVSQADDLIIMSNGMTCWRDATVTPMAVPPGSTPSIWASTIPAPASAMSASARTSRWIPGRGRRFRYRVSHNDRLGWPMSDRRSGMRDFAEDTRRYWVKQLCRRLVTQPGRRTSWLDDSLPARDEPAYPLRSRLIEFHLTDGRWIVGMMDE